MDPIIKQKLDGFANLIHGEIKRQSDMIKADCDAMQSERIAARKAQLSAEAEAFYDHRMAQTKDAVQEALSAAQSATRRDNLDMNQNILKQLIEAIEQRTIQFVERPRYRAFIEQKIDGLAAHLQSFDQLVIYANPADRTWLEQCFKARTQAALRFEVLGREQIGGVIIEVPAAHFRYNMTLKSLIDDNIDLIGAKLYALFEEMEKVHGS